MQTLKIFAAYKLEDELNIFNLISQESSLPSKWWPQFMRIERGDRKIH
jgi:hypothetical protein